MRQATPSHRVAGSSVRRTSEQTQALVFAEARRLLNLKGYVGMTLREVAAGAGIEPQSVYNYVSSKQDLVVALMLGGTAAIQAAVDSAVAEAGDTAADRLRAAAYAHTRHYCSGDRAVLICEGIVHVDDERRVEVIRALKQYEETFKSILRDGIESGEFRPVDVTATC